MGILLDVLNWIISNTGNLGMFILTIFIAFYSKKSSKASLEASQLAKKEFESKKEPEIIIYFELNEDTLDFKMENIGNGVATNITASLEEKSGNFHKSYMCKIKNGLFDTTIKTFAPTQEIKGIAAEISDIKDDSGYPVFTCNFSYYDINGNQYSRSYDFDLNYIGGLVWSKKATLKDVTENLKGINKEIEKLNAKF